MGTVTAHIHKQSAGMHTHLLQTQTSDAAASAKASLLRLSADRNAVRDIDEALRVLKAEMAKENADFLARVKSFLVECDDSAESLRALSLANHRLCHER